jgi:hypothetical protein
MRTKLRSPPGATSALPSANADARESYSPRSYTSVLANPVGVDRTETRPPRNAHTPPSGRANTAFSLVPPSGALTMGSDVQPTPPPGTTVPMADRSRVGPEDATQTVPVAATDTSVK